MYVYVGENLWLYFRYDEYLCSASCGSLGVRGFDPLPIYSYFCKHDIHTGGEIGLVSPCEVGIDGLPFLYGRCMWLLIWDVELPLVLHRHMLDGKDLVFLARLGLQQARLGRTSIPPNKTKTWQKTPCFRESQDFLYETRLLRSKTSLFEHRPNTSGAVLGTPGQVREPGAGLCQNGKHRLWKTLKEHSECRWNEGWRSVDEALDNWSREAKMSSAGSAQLCKLLAHRWAQITSASWWPRQARHVRWVNWGGVITSLVPWSNRFDSPVYSWLSCFFVASKYQNKKLRSKHLLLDDPIRLLSSATKTTDGSWLGLRWGVAEAAKERAKVWRDGRNDQVHFDNVW